MLGLEQKPSPHEFLQIGTMHWFPPGSVFQPGQQYEWKREPHTLGPLSVSWPRRRTRCTSLCSAVPVKRLAWYAPFPVCAPITWTAARHTAAHPSSTWASITGPIGHLAFPPTLPCSDFWFSVWTQATQGFRLGFTPSPWVHSRAGLAAIGVPRRRGALNRIGDRMCASQWNIEL